MKSYPTIAVIGAGMMGAEIAYCFACREGEVLLKDIDMKTVQAGRKRIETILAKSVDNGKIDRVEADRIINRIILRDDYSGFEDVDLIIEAALEDKAVKGEIFKEIDEICRDECIFASNTSSIPIAELAAVTKRPDRFIGLHFFSPAAIMKLVEVIAGVETSQDTMDSAIQMVRLAGKEPIRVKDCAGFLVNRLLFAFFNEAWRAVDEGVATPEDVDKAVKLGLGHPLGIFQMQDLVGLDNALAVSTILHEEYGERYKPSPLLKRKVAARHFGRKVQKGWFDYGK